MLKIFSALLGRRTASSPNVAAPSSAQVHQAAAGEPPPLESFFPNVIRGCGLFRPEGESAALEFLQFRARYSAEVTGRPTEVQKAEWAAVDASMNRRAFEVLKEPLPPRRKLAPILGQLYSEAMIQRNRLANVMKMRGAGVDEMTLELTNIGNECAWCKASAGKRFSTQEDPNELLARNCSCKPSPGGYFNAVIAGFKD